MASLTGPRRLTNVRPVAIPASLLQRSGLDSGSKAGILIPCDDPTMVRILPAARAQVAT